MSETTSRRDFLAVTAVAVATAGGCGNQDPNSLTADPGGDPMNFTASPRNATNPGGTDTTVCGATSGLMVGPAAQDLGLNQQIPMGTITYNGVQGPLIACRDADGIVGLFNRCTHLGCTPVYNVTVARWICPCHGSQYTVTGLVVNPPATVSMVRFAACKGADGLIRIDLSKKLP